MARVVRRQAHKTRRLYGLILFIFLLAAAGTILYRYPPSLLVSSGIFRLAADKISGTSADPASADPVLRGTIFDRKFNELAVSYPLYSLFVRPREVVDPAAAARVLADITGSKGAVLEAQLKQAANILKIAENLEPEEVKELRAEPLAGVYLKPVESRFYPAHETAAGLLGYTGEGVGLAGIEGAYDLVLQQGAIRSDNLPEIDLRGTQVIGNAAMDLVLTIDLALQKEVEQQLLEYLQGKEADKGLALCLDVKTGAVLAWAGRPSYNPNYYWKLADSSGNDIFQASLAPGLYRDLLVRAAALTKSGDLGDPLPPATVAAIDHGLGPDEINAFAESLGMAHGAPAWLPMPALAEEQIDPDPAFRESLVTSATAQSGMAARLRAGHASCASREWRVGIA